MAVIKSWFTDIFFEKTAGTKKLSFRLFNFKWLFALSTMIFIAVVALLPDEQDLKFSYKKASTPEKTLSRSDEAPTHSGGFKASSLWSAGSSNSLRAQVNHESSMIVGGGPNAKNRIQPGARLPIRILDKVTVSEAQVPVLAELIVDSVTDSGLRIPAGSRFYGEASFQKGQSRATVQFKQISFPNGKIRAVSGQAIGKDGQPGVVGHVFSDGLKNTTGQLITTFVAGLAGGAIQTDVFGRTKGGIENGLLNAVSQTAQSRAQAYGEKLKTEREWIEVRAGQEADVVLSEAMDLNEGGGTYER